MIGRELSLKEPDRIDALAALDRCCRNEDAGKCSGCPYDGTSHCSRPCRVFLGERLLEILSEIDDERAEHLIMLLRINVSMECPLYDESGTDHETAVFREARSLLAEYGLYDQPSRTA